MSPDASTILSVSILVLLISFLLIVLVSFWRNKFHQPPDLNTPSTTTPTSNTVQNTTHSTDLSKVDSQINDGGSTQSEQQTNLNNTGTPTHKTTQENTSQSRSAPIEHSALSVMMSQSSLAPVTPQKEEENEAKKTLNFKMTNNGTGETKQATSLLSGIVPEQEEAAPLPEIAPMSTIWVHKRSRASATEPGNTQETETPSMHNFETHRSILHSFLSTQ